MFHIFVGHVFSTEQIEDLRPALRAGIQAVGGGDLWFADEHPGTDYLFDRIKNGIDNAFACIFEISDSTRPNVFLELGYAIARRIPCVLICRKGTVIPSDLRGIEFLEYQSYNGLSRQLRNSFAKMLPGGTPINKALVLMLATEPDGSEIPRVRLIAKAKSQGVTEGDLDSSLAALEGFGVIQTDGEGIRILEREILTQWAHLAKE